MAVSTTQLRQLAAANYADNITQEISPKDLRDGMYLVADIMDAANVDQVIEAVDVYVQEARGYSQAAATSASNAATDRTFVQTAVADMFGGNTGQVLVKSSNTDFDYAWVTLENAGDMLKVMYDPMNVLGDAFRTCGSGR